MMCQELPGGEYADFITLKGGINYENIHYKIPPYLPLSKGGNIPLFGKEGLGEIFQ